MINSLDLGKKVIKDKIPLISRNPGIYKMISSTGEIINIDSGQRLAWKTPDVINAKE